MFSSRTQATSGGATVDTEVVFNRNPNWWGGTPGIQVLTVKRYETAAAVNSALLDGSLDMVIGSGVLAPASLNSLMTNTNFNVVWTGVLMHTLVIINSGRAPTDDIALRKAIIHGVDKASIIQSELSGIGQAVDRVFPRSAPYSSVELTPRWDYDYEKSRLLNCPTPPAGSDDDDSDLVLGLGLGLGLGLPMLLACVAAVIFFQRNQKAEGRCRKTELELKEAMARLLPPPSKIGFTDEKGGNSS
jgi:hypothetical protein